MEKKACFIGHRTVPDAENLREKIRTTVERLIIEEDITVFLFGSRSDFDTLCHGVVTELQEAYPAIRRVVYTCRHECVTLKENKERAEQIQSRILKRPVHIKDYDGEYEYPAKYTSGRASYVERNQALIDDSDVCVFYYDETYLPPRRKSNGSLIADEQPKSGTAAAYRYALRRGKEVINLCSEKSH